MNEFWKNFERPTDDDVRCTPTPTHDDVTNRLTRKLEHDHRPYLLICNACCH